MAFVHYLAYQGTDLLAKVIKWETQGHYSHIAYVYDPDHAIEVWPDSPKELLRCTWKYRKLLAGYKPGDRYEIWGLEVSDAAKDLIDAFFLKLVKTGAKFDYLAGFGLFVKWRKERKGQYFCSEGCITPLKLAFAWDKIEPWKITPDAFVWILQAAGGKLVKTGLVPGHK